MNKDELKKLQAELNSISEKKFSKLSDAKLAANDLIAQRNKDKEFIKKVKEGKKGFKHSEEVKNKISQKNKGKKQSIESSIKKSIATKGKSKSEKHKQKISKALKGKSKSDEHRKKLAEARKGKQNKKLSDSNSKLNSTIYFCKYCKRDIGGYANFVRFHNNNCKHKK